MSWKYTYGRRSANQSRWFFFSPKTGSIDVYSLHSLVRYIYIHKPSYVSYVNQVSFYLGPQLQIEKSKAGKHATSRHSFRWCSSAFLWVYPYWCTTTLWQSNVEKSIGTGETYSWVFPFINWVDFPGHVWLPAPNLWYWYTPNQSLPAIKHAI